MVCSSESCFYLQQRTTTLFAAWLLFTFHYRILTEFHYTFSLLEEHRQESEDHTAYRTERSFGQFSRSFRIPTTADASKVFILQYVHCKYAHSVRFFPCYVHCIYLNCQLFRTLPSLTCVVLQISASCENGVLKVTLPKKALEAASAVSITIGDKH